VDASFLIAVAIALGLVSLMMVLRLGAGGAGVRRILQGLAELWVVVGLWIALFWWLSSGTGPPAGAGGVAELRDLPARLARLPAATRVGAVVWLAVCVAGIMHLMWWLRRMIESSAG
jgi:hypothetical protein